MISFASDSVITRISYSSCVITITCITDCTCFVITVIGDNTQLYVLLHGYVSNIVEPDPTINLNEFNTYLLEFCIYINARPITMANLLSCSLSYDIIEY